MQLPLVEIACGVTLGCSAGSCPLKLTALETTNLSVIEVVNQLDDTRPRERVCTFDLLSRRSRHCRFCDSREVPREMSPNALCPPAAGILVSAAASACSRDPIAAANQVGDPAVAQRPVTAWQLVSGRWQNPSDAPRHPLPPATR
jgi:hypothetical protein